MTEKNTREEYRELSFLWQLLGYTHNERMFYTILKSPRGVKRSLGAFLREHYPCFAEYAALSGEELSAQLRISADRDLPVIRRALYEIRREYFRTPA